MAPSPCAILRPWTLALLFIAVETVFLAVVVAMAWERGDHRAHPRAHWAAGTDEIEPRLRSLRDRMADLEWQNSQLLRDVSVAGRPVRRRASSASMTTRASTTQT